MIAQGLVSDVKNLGEILTGSTPMGASNRGGYVKTAIFDQYLAISQKRCKIGT